MKHRGNVEVPNKDGQHVGLWVEKVSDIPTFTADDAGRFLFNTSDGYMYYCTNIKWIRLGEVDGMYISQEPLTFNNTIAQYPAKTDLIIPALIPAVGTTFQMDGGAFGIGTQPTGTDAVRIELWLTNAVGTLQLCTWFDITADNWVANKAFFFDPLKVVGGNIQIKAFRHNGSATGPAVSLNPTLQMKIEYSKARRA